MFSFDLAENLIVHFSSHVFSSSSDVFRIRIGIDISDGRFQGWIIMIENWSWFGHKNLQDITDQKIIFGHNTWLSHLNYNGILATFCFLGWNSPKALHTIFTHRHRSENRDKVVGRA